MYFYQYIILYLLTLNIFVNANLPKWYQAWIDADWERISLTLEIN